MDDIEKAVRDLKAWEIKKKAQVRKIIAKTSKTIESEAIALAPVSPGGGNLRDSMYVKLNPSGLGAEIGDSADYAYFVEFGTGKYNSKGEGREKPWVYYSEELGRYVYTEGMKPQPFLFPAFESNRPKYLNDLRKALESK